MKMLAQFVLLCLFPFLLPAEEIVARKIIAFWDSNVETGKYQSGFAQDIEMPLNYLGLDVEYHDIKEPLPDLTHRPDVRGIVFYLDATIRFKSPKEVIDWAIQAIDLGKKVVLLGYAALFIDQEGLFTDGNEINRLYERLGFAMTTQSIDYTYRYSIIHKNSANLDFEKPLPHPLPAFGMNRVISSRAKSWLTVGIEGQPDSYSDLIIVTPFGGFVSQGYEIIHNQEISSELELSEGWYLNPFAFFETVLELASFPIADVTTLAGRRIYYSHCDGDSWNIKSSVEKYRDQGWTCAQVLLEEVVKAHPELPMTMGIIAADLDPSWVGSEKAQEIARQFYAQPNVEAGSHTYSHPFEWGFFEHDANKKEIYFLGQYPYGSWQNSFLSWLFSRYYQYFPPAEFNKIKLKQGYTIPRAYANKPFNIHEEITGSIDYLKQFVPVGKKLAMLQWSGDCLPWAQAVELSYASHVKNINGGGVRLDPEFPSILFVCPLGRKPGGWIQVYASANAEIGYTDGWTKRFFGFIYVQKTWENTNSPRRLKPLNLYYHCYSVQMQESLNALLDNINYIKNQELILVKTSKYSDIVEGFYLLQIVELTNNCWKILNRQGLQTIRFDHNDHLVVDIDKSYGVIGYRRYLDSIYIYLDAEISEPMIQMSTQVAHQPNYLIDSNWEVWNLKKENGLMTFLAQGWDKLSMRWEMHRDGNYIVQAIYDNHVQEIRIETSAHVLQVELELPFDRVVQLEIKEAM